MMFGCFTNADRIKVSAFKENIAGFFSHSRFDPSKNTGDAHAIFGIANHQVGGGKFAIHFIQSCKWCSLRKLFYHNFFPCYIFCIESM